MVLVWRIARDSPNSPNFLSAKLSCYAVNAMVTQVSQINPHSTIVPLTVPRAMATDVHVIDHYFEMLTDTLSDNGLMHKPMQLYNCDETGMPLGAYHHKVVTQAGSNPTCITSNSSKS